VKEKRVRGGRSEPVSVPFIREVKFKGSRVVLVGAVKGLVSEGVMVGAEIRSERPDAVCLHISKEELEGLKAVVKGKVRSTYLSSYEKVYAKKLSRFGEVQIPPPSLVEAYRAARELGIPCYHLDMDDGRYSRVYTKNIGGLPMVMQSLRLKRVHRRKFKGGTPQRFSVEWDSVVNRFGGYRRVEEARETYMAERILKLTRKHAKLLAVLEYERMRGIMDALVEMEALEPGL